MATRSHVEAITVETRSEEPRGTARQDTWEGRGDLEHGSGRRERGSTAGLRALRGGSFSSTLNFSLSEFVSMALGKSP